MSGLRASPHAESAVSAYIVDRFVAAPQVATRSMRSQRLVYVFRPLTRERSPSEEGTAMDAHIHLYIGMESAAKPSAPGCRKCQCVTAVS